MPGVQVTNAVDQESAQKVKADSIKLWLPSQLDAENRDATCLGGVVNSEKDLRFAQLEDSLNDLRQARRTRCGLILFHKVQLAGQGQRTQTKSQAAMRTIQDRINRCVHRYRVARNALVRLAASGDWSSLYLPLTDNDNRGPGKEPEEMACSDGQYSPSWIWRSATTTISPDEVNENMRVEWAQCMARADRWEEEVILLQEEMRRVVQFLEWRSGDWLTKADSRAGTTPPTVHSGLSAYANKQSAIFHNLTVRFCQQWHSVLVSLSLPHKWASDFLDTCKEPLSDPNPAKRKRKKGPPVVNNKSSVFVSAPTPPILAHPETISDEVEVSDSDSDGIPSGYDGSGYSSNLSE